MNVTICVMCGFVKPKGGRRVGCMSEWGPCVFLKGHHSKCRFGVVRKHAKVIAEDTKIAKVSKPFTNKAIAHIVG